MKRSYPLIFTLVAAILSGCRTHQNPVGEPVNVPPGSFMHSWSATPEFDTIHGFYLSNDMILVHGDDNYLAAYDLHGGLKFRTQVGNPIEAVGEPMVTPDRIIVPLSSSLKVLTRDGFHKTVINVGQPIRSSGVVLGQAVYLGTDSVQGGRLSAIALDREFNVTLWTRLAGGLVRERPAVHDNVIYFATETGRVVALTTDPTLLWPRAPEMPDQIFHAGGQILAGIKADDAGVFVPCVDGKLYCLDPVTGRIRWEWLAEKPVLSTPQLTTDSAYVYMEDRGLVALSKKSNRYATPRWVLADGRKVLADDAKLVYVLTSGGRICAVDKASGVVQYSSQRNDILDGVTHLDPKDNTLFVLTKGGYVMAIRPVNRAGEVGSLVMADGQAMQVMR